MNLTIYQAGAKRLGSWLLLAPLLWIFFLLAGGNFFLATEYLLVLTVSAIAWETLRWVPDIRFIVRHSAALAGIGALIELFLWLCDAPIAGNIAFDAAMLGTAPVVLWATQPVMRIMPDK